MNMREITVEELVEIIDQLQSGEIITVTVEADDE